MSNQSKQASTVLSILSLLGVSHMLNDTLQSVISAVYPLLKDSLLLTYTQIGIITLVFQLASSIFQPVVGFITDRKPQPYSLPIGMVFTTIGILTLAYANSLTLVLIAVFFTGFGSSIFHPEASRLTFLASGKKHGLAQSIFQVGGSLGGSLGPLLAAYLITPYGQKNIEWLTSIAFVSILIMLYISHWYKERLRSSIQPTTNIEYNLKTISDEKPSTTDSVVPHKKIKLALTVLLILIFSKYVYLGSLTSYYTFYLINKFGLDFKDAQLYLFIFLFASAIGTFIGGPIGDRIGRKHVIWGSILGAAPFALAMPHVGLVWTCILSILVGLILSSAFSAILVYAQELLPHKVGLISGLFFGVAFAIAGIASAVLGKIADLTSIQHIYSICAYLPLIGFVTVFLPNDKKQKK